MVKKRWRKSENKTCDSPIATVHFYYIILIYLTFSAGLPVVSKDNMIILYKIYVIHTKIWAFGHTLNYNLFKGYTMQFSIKYTKQNIISNCYFKHCSVGHELLKTRGYIGYLFIFKISSIDLTFNWISML